MTEILLEFLGWLVILSWAPGIIFSMAVMDFRDRPLGIGFLLGLILGPIGWIVACVLPSMTEEDLIRREVRRLRIEREARTIIERENAGTAVRQPSANGASGLTYVMIGGVIIVLLMLAALTTMMSFNSR